MMDARYYELFEQAEKAALELLENYRSDADKYRQKLSDLLDKYDGKKVRASEILVELLYYNYCSSLFFPDEQILQLFKQSRFTNLELKWFIGHQNLLDEIRKINNSGQFIIVPVEVVYAAYQYCTSKIWDLLLKKFGYTGKVYHRKANLAAVAVNKYQNRVKKRTIRANTENKLFDQFMDNVYTMFDKFKNPYYSASDILPIAEGRCDTMISTLFNNGMLPNPIYSGRKIGISEKRRQFFPIARLIMVDKNLMSEEEFGKNSRREGSYDGTWSEYAAKRLQSILKDKSV